MSPKNTFYILCGLIGLVVVGGGAGFYLAHAQLANRIDEMRLAQAEAAVASEEIERLQQLEEAYSDAQELESKVDRVLPDEKRQSEVANVVFAMIEGAGMEGSGLSFEGTDGIPDRTTQTDEAPLDDVLVMPITFNVTGTYQQLLVFLDNVERQERLMQITSLSINRTGDEEEGGQLDLSIELEVFLQS